MLRIVTDNNYKGYDISPSEYDDLRRIADCRLDQLSDSNDKELWLFPRKGDRYDDKIDDQSIISITDNKFTTGNIMGFVGCGNTELTIRSRFTYNNDQDWFMEYMLQKVFAINIFNLKHGKGSDDVLNITALMFPYFLQKALYQGVYREYVRCEHNDSRVRGAINFNAHIKVNYPFKNGKIAYTTREYVYDNSITQIVRHTIEFLKTDKMSWNILCSSNETQANIKQIINATPSYRKGDLKKVLLANIKPKIHPYYSEYGPLQKLCIQILQRRKLNYGNSSDRIYGILFDGAWLWEEYLNLTLKKAHFEHPENRLRKGGVNPFSNRNCHTRYPDFLYKNPENSSGKYDIVADTKYKRIVELNSATRKAKENLQRDDLNQMITYLHITSAKTGIFISPCEHHIINQETGNYEPNNDFLICEKELFVYNMGNLEGYGGDIYVLGINIPKSAKNYSEFTKTMEQTERVLLESIDKIISPPLGRAYKYSFL